MTQITDGRILVIDDDEGVVHSMTRLIEALNLSVDAAMTLKEGLSKIDKGDFDVVLLDVRLPDGNGIEAINDISSGLALPPQIIIMTAYSDADSAELAIEKGAWDYIRKPACSQGIRLQILRALQFQEQKKKSAASIQFDAPDVIGNSISIQKCLNQAAQILNSDGNVMITGETGTGKELFARAIHDNSARRNGEFIVVDCSILSENLIESVLFGHEKGAFTGAQRERKGLIELANGGTLFLDEVGELPESIQASFLRVLQEKTYRPVGSEKEGYSNFRVICATNRDIDQMAAEHRFRSDLLFRLTTFVLNLPPLRERGKDISQIAKCQVKKSCMEHGIPIKQISPDFIDVLEKYEWPGNVRELVNAIEKGVTAAQFESTLFAFHLPVSIRVKVTQMNIEDTESTDNKMITAETVSEELTHKEVILKIEKEYFERLYTSHNGDIQKMIDRSGLSRTALYRKLKLYHIK